MPPISHFRTQLRDLRSAMKLRALVADLHLQVHLLDQGIHDEEQRTGIFDVTNVTYPMLARTLRARRDNLLATISVLQPRMTDADHKTRLETTDVTQATQDSAMIRRAQA